MCILLLLCLVIIPKQQNMLTYVHLTKTIYADYFNKFVLAIPQVVAIFRHAGLYILPCI